MCRSKGCHFQKEVQEEEEEESCNVRIIEKKRIKVIEDKEEGRKYERRKGRKGKKGKKLYGILS